MKRFRYYVTSIVTLFLFSFCFTASSGEIPEIPEIPIDEMNRCRCKHDGCYGGNLISLRPKCAVDDEPIDCTEYTMNCPGNSTDDASAPTI